MDLNVPILDKHFDDDLSDLISQKEEIVWMGQPYYKSSFLSVFQNFKADSLSNFSCLYGIYFYFFIFSSVAFLATGFYSPIFAIASIGFILLIIPSILRNKKKQKTFYAITDQFIYFQLQKWNKKNVHAIAIKEIHSLMTSTYKNNSGTIFIHHKNPSTLNFDTYDFSSGKKRNQPTFEMIENVEEVAKKLQQLILQT